MTTTLPAGIPFVSETGEVGVLSGKMVVPAVTMVEKNWAVKVHPERKTWVEDEEKQRASYIATRSSLAPFLVPHRFEGKVAPIKLNRARLGFGVGLNKAYLHEIFGHIRSTPTHYTWGVLQMGGERDTTKPPAAGVADTMWWDATGTGETWRNFFESKVLEWMGTSVGGFVLVDSNRQEGIRMSQATAQRLGIRSTLRFIPWSWVEDFGRDDLGNFRWMKIREHEDIRTPKGDPSAPSMKKLHLLYELQEDGRTMISRWDDNAKQIGPDVFQNLVNAEGRPMLPLIPAKIGDHPTLDYVGSGLLIGLDDIVIDIFNLLSEIREAYRDAAFGFLKFKGPDPEAVKKSLEDGSRLVHIGDDPHSSMEREAADSGEVTAGLAIFDLSLKAWALSAKRRAIEMVDTQSPNPKSGISLKAEFELDLRPLLVAVSETLDQVETQVMYVLAQIEGETPKIANVLLVRRETEFQLEQEASRIARIVKEFLEAIPGMPPELMTRMIMRWAESIDFLDLDEVIEGQTLREILQAQAEEIADTVAKTKLLETLSKMDTASLMGQPKPAAAPNGNGAPAPQPPQSAEGAEAKKILMELLKGLSKPRTTRITGRDPSGRASEATTTQG